MAGGTWDVRWGGMVLAVLGAIATSSPALGQYISVPDPNFETALAVYDDIPGDGQVPTAAVSAVTSLDVGSSNISDLTGIAAFSALQVLRVDDNQLTTLNVSANTSLQELACDSNDLSGSLSLKGLASLTTMDATDNPALACIEVDDVVAATAGGGIYAGWSKDVAAAYAPDCVSPTPTPTAIPTPSATPAPAPTLTATPAPTSSPLPTPTAAPTATLPAESRLITFVNRCKEPIWLAELGTPEVDPDQWALAPRCNAANAALLCPTGICDGGACSCQSDADCTFDQTVSPAPSCDQSTDRCVKSTTVAVDATWSGRFWARTGCTGSSGAFTCETGQCGGPGNVDCTVSADVATLFEITGGGYDTVDVFDVSLVSGYNVPLAAKAIRPASPLGWTANTVYAANQQVVERIGTDVFLFQNTGLAGTSGSSRPAFPDVLFESVPEGANIVWTNVNAVCEPSGCRKGGIREHECPPVLRVLSGDKYVGCNAPANSCAGSGSGCEDHLDYYQCQNDGGARDQFGKVLTLQSANGASYVCFSAADCPPGTTCELDPAFESGYRMAKGAGLCTPIAQNGGCTPGDDGDPCPAIGFPFVDYQCQTLSNVPSNAQVCVPPKTRGLGDLWWNAHNWTPAPAAPTPTPAGTPGSPTPTPAPVCVQDTDCGAGQKCLLTPPSPNGGLRQCPGGNGCTCWNPTACTSSSECVPGKCLDQNGVENADCASSETCYCAPQGIYSGTCGAANAKWLQAGRKISAPGARWPQTMKDRCPRAYSFQFDDPSSSWSCLNPGSALNGYRVVFCGGVSRVR